MQTHRKFSNRRESETLMHVCMIVQYFHGWLYEGNESSSCKCWCAVEAEWSAFWWHACLWMTMLFAESARKFQRTMDEFYSVCLRRNLKVNVGKSKVTVLESRSV